MKARIVAASLILLAAAPASAEVVDRSAAGFEIQHVITLQASMEKARAAVLDIGRWWSKAHTWSGDPANLSIDLKTGCFCEKLKTGFVRHMTIVYADAGALRMAGALGPLQFTGATGHLGFKFEALTANQTKLTLTYDVGGYAKGGLEQGWADPVDAVLGAQLKRLEALVDTGKIE